MQDSHRHPIERVQRYDPELYAALHRGTRGDEAFYAHLPGARVLELGCGYGRLIAALSGPQRTYVGLDIDVGLLSLARQELSRRPRSCGPFGLLRADMRDFAFRSEFDLIVLPFSGLFCLPNARAVLSCFVTVRRHLAPGGLFVLDAYCLDAFHAEADPEQISEEDWVARVDAAGTQFDVYEDCFWNRERQRLETTYRYAPLSGGQERFGHIAHYYLLSDQLRRLLVQAGFQITTALGSFEGQAFDPQGDHLILMCTRAGAKPC